MILHTSAALVGYFFTKYIPVKRYYLPGTGKSMPIVSHAQDFLATTEGRCECEGRVVSNDALIYARSEGELIPCLKLKKICYKFIIARMMERLVCFFAGLDNSLNLILR